MNCLMLKVTGVVSLVRPVRSLSSFVLCVCMQSSIQDVQLHLQAKLLSPTFGECPVEDTQSFLLVLSVV